MLLASTVFGTPTLFFSPLCHSHHLLRVAISGLRASAAPLRLLPPPAAAQHLPGPVRSGPNGSESSSSGNIQLMRHIACNFLQQCSTCGCLVTSPPPFGRATCRDARHSRFAALREGRPDGPDRTRPGCLKEPTMGTGTPEPTPLGESAGSPVISPELTECSPLADKSSCGFCFKVAAIVTLKKKKHNIKTKHNFFGHQQRR